MAKKSSGINIEAMTAMDAAEVEQKKRDAAFMGSAPLQEAHIKPRKSGGRPKAAEKASKNMVAYFTEDEVEKVKDFCGRESFSGVVRRFFKERGVLE